ncbi:hypothetical protein ACFLQU_00715 [Verrucomicrobiota bacterium]
MKSSSQTLVLCAVLFALCSPAMANTRFGFGTILSVDAEGKDDKNKTPNYVVHYEFRNLAWTRIWHNERYRFHERTRHGYRVYFLDGKPSKPLEALKVGRAICHSDNDMVIHVSSKPGPFVAGTIDSAQNGLARITLKGAVKTTAAKVNRGQVGTMRPLGSDIDLMLDLSDKRIEGGAVTAAFHGASEHSIDCSGFKRDGENIEGAFSVEVPFGKNSRYKLKEGDALEGTYAFKASVNAKGVVTGSYEGTCQAKPIKGVVSGATIARSAMPKQPRLWMQFDPFPGARKGYVIVSFEGGKAKAGGRILFSKGHPIGDITAQDLTLDGATIKGTLTGKLRDGEITFDIDAKVLGNRWVTGRCTMKLGESTTAVTFRGGLCEADTVQLESATAEQKVEMKRMQAEFEPKAAPKRAPQPKKKPKPKDDIVPDLTYSR